MAPARPDGRTLAPPRPLRVLPFARLLGPETTEGEGDEPISITPTKVHDVAPRRRRPKGRPPGAPKEPSKVLITRGRRPAIRVQDAGMRAPQRAPGAVTTPLARRPLLPRPPARNIAGRVTVRPQCRLIRVPASLPILLGPREPRHHLKARGARDVPPPGAPMVGRPRGPLNAAIGDQRKKYRAKNAARAIPAAAAIDRRGGGGR